MRALQDDRIQELADTIERNGLINRPTVRRKGGEIWLVTGRHRLEAFILKGWHKIPVVDLGEVDDIDAQMMEIAEKIFRYDLKSEVEKSAHRAKYAELQIEKDKIERAVAFATQPEIGSSGTHPEAPNHEAQYNYTSASLETAAKKLNVTAGTLADDVRIIAKLTPDMIQFAAKHRLGERFLIEAVGGKKRTRVVVRPKVRER